MKLSQTSSKDDIQKLRALLEGNGENAKISESIQRLTQMAAEIFNVPLCVVSLVDSERQWFLSKSEIFIVEDAEKDPEFQTSPFVVEEPHLKFYAGAPIKSRDGDILGTFCLADIKPKKLQKHEKQWLQSLADQAMDLLLLKKNSFELEESQRQSRDIQKMSRAGGWTLNPETSEVYWTEEVYHIHKVPLGTPVDKINAINFYAEHDRPRIQKCVDDCMTLYKPYDEEFEFIDAEGIHKWVRAIGEPILGPKGKLIRVTGTFQDITDLKRREVALQRMAKSLKENHGRLSLALDTLNMGVWDLSLVKNTLIWDERMFQIFGENTNNTMNGQLIWQKSLHPDDLERVNREMQDCISDSQREFRSECRIIRRDGNIRYIKMVAQVIKDDTGKALRMVGVTWDDTEEQLNAEELRKQRKMANHNAKLAAIGELAAGVAHEINNPLTIISGFINLMEKNLVQDSWDKTRLLEVVKKIDISAERIAKIVKGLKNFSRVDKDVITRFDMVEAISETVSMLAGIYHREGVEIDTDFHTKHEVMLEGNRGKIQQVLINLISNAKDATNQQPERKITVRLIQEKRIVRLQVIDNGPGIPKEMRERVFEPFFTTKDVNEGTGIGLSLVHNIVSEHNGSVRVEDAATDIGAIFTVELPSLKQAS